jgi:hypothetical protein
LGEEGKLARAVSPDTIENDGERERLARSTAESGHEETQGGCVWNVEAILVQAFGNTRPSKPWSSSLQAINHHRNVPGVWSTGCRREAVKSEAESSCKAQAVVRFKACVGTGQQAQHFCHYKLIRGREVLEKAVEGAVVCSAGIPQLLHGCCQLVGRLQVIVAAHGVGEEKAAAAACAAAAQKECAVW